MVLETALCVCVCFHSDQGWQSLSQTTGFIFNQRLAPFLSFGEIRYSKHITPTYLLHYSHEDNAFHFAHTLSMQVEVDLPMESEMQILMSER